MSAGEIEIDNSKLEEIMKRELTPEMQREFFEIFKDSQLFMPVTYSDSLFEGIENAKEEDVVEIDDHVGFNINYLTDKDGNNAIPLFTSTEIMEKIGLQSSAMAIFMSDLAGMLLQTDKYSVIAINPFTDFDLNLPVDAFMNLMGKNDSGEKMNIEDIHHDRIRELLKKRGNLSEEELAEFSDELFKSTLITGCVNTDDGTGFALIWDNENVAHMPLFTDIEEFEKIFSEYDEIFPQAYHFTDYLKIAKEDFVINPASESLKLDPEMFRQ